MQQIREFRSNFEEISHDCPATVPRLSCDIRESVSRLTHECGLFSFSFVRQSTDIRESVARHSYECRLVLFSRQIVVRYSHVFSRQSHDRPTTLAQYCKFSKISRRHVLNTRTNVARQSCEIFLQKNSHKIFKHV